MTPTIERPDPPYLQVVNHIRGQIYDGTLAEGTTIPSARRIAAEWSVSLATATKVLAALRSEGLVNGLVGIGTIVLPVVTTPQRNFLAMHRTGRIYPAGSHARIVSAEVSTAPPDVADALGFHTGEEVIRRRRITYRGEQPQSASTSWFAGHLATSAPLLLKPDRLPQGTARYIEEVTGRRAVRGTDRLTAGLATHEEAQDLSVPVGSAILRGVCSYIDADDAVIEFGEHASPGHLGWTSAYEIPTERNAEAT